MYYIVLHVYLLFCKQEGDVALIVSARGGDYETVKVLLNNEADPNIDQEYEFVSTCMYIVYMYLIISFYFYIRIAASMIRN